MRNVRIWKKQALEYQQQGNNIDDPALDKVEKPDSNKSIDTKEMQRLQQIENDYTEEEKILKLVARQHRDKAVKNSDSQPDVNINQLPIQNGLSAADLKAIFAGNMMASQHLSSNQTPSDPQKRTTTSQAELQEQKRNTISSGWIEQQIKWLNREMTFLTEMSYIF